MLTVKKLALALPVVFAVHVIEEAPRFVPWFNSLVSPPISQPLFLSVNAVAFVITVAVGLLLSASPERGPALIAVAWVGFLMLANGLFHIVATVVHGRYCPGVVTGALLYLPFSLLFVRAVAREVKLSGPAVVMAALVGAVPMFVHGYLIVFRGSRLF
jgi:hypothetical protein